MAYKFGRGMKYNRHHIIGKATNQGKYNYENPERGRYNVNHPSNIVVMDVIDHANLHNFFQTLRDSILVHFRTPKEQIKYHTDITRTVMSDKAKQLLDELLNMPDEEFYNNEIV